MKAVRLGAAGIAMSMAVLLGTSRPAEAQELSSLNQRPSAKVVRFDRELSSPKKPVVQKGVSIKAATAETVRSSPRVPVHCEPPFSWKRALFVVGLTMLLAVTSLTRGWG